MERIQAAIDAGLEGLFDLWDELGIEEAAKDERNQTVLEHFNRLINKMQDEERAAKKKILDSLEHHTKQVHKLCKELGISYDEPDSSLPLVKCEQAIRHEALRIKEIKEERMREVRQLRRQDEELCQRLAMDPYYVSSTTVPTSSQMEGLKEHIRSLEEEKFARLEQFVSSKEAIIHLYTELEIEPSTEFEREVACEETDRFILSQVNMEKVARILSGLEEQVKLNQRRVMECVERLDCLYDRLQLNMNDKFQFLAEHQGHSTSVIQRLEAEVERLEEIKKANIEKFVINLRDELHRLWDECYYSEQQRNAFTPLHSTNFTEELLEAHEAEARRMKDFYSLHGDLFRKVAQRQEVWNKFMELERRAKDPSRLMNARGNSLLIEEKERNKVNKALPKLEKELHDLIQEWEETSGQTFLVNGVNFMEYISRQKEDHINQLESEKIAREQAKKKTLLHETQFGTKPATPAKLKQQSMSIQAKTPGRKVVTPSSSRLLSRMQQGLATIRSPRAGKIAKGTSPRVGGTAQPKSFKEVAAQKERLKRGVLSEIDNSIITRSTRSASNLTLQSVDYAKFKKGTQLNSTEADTPELARGAGGRLLPSYMTPTMSAQNRMFKTPTTPASRSRLGTPKSASTSKLSSLRSNRALPYLI